MGLLGGRSEPCCSSEAHEEVAKHNTKHTSSSRLRGTFLVASGPGSYGAPAFLVEAFASRLEPRVGGQRDHRRGLLEINEQGHRGAKRVDWELWVRMDKIMCTVLREAHERQIEETMDALSDGPEGACTEDLPGRALVGARRR